MPRVIAAAALAAASCLWAGDVELAARATVSAVELDVGETLKFRLRNGEVRRLEVVETGARVLASNLRVPRKAQSDGGTLYLMRAVVKIDGHPWTLLRYVGAQESFSEPYVVNGMRVWLDAVSDALALMTDDHGGSAGCAMTKRVRLAVNDARDALAPVELRPWIPLAGRRLEIAKAYNGDDPYMGAYQGAECHAGLDINHPKGSPLFAPVAIDDHYYFNSLAKGDNNNRWRGTHQWPDGDVWTLQSHHMVELLIPEHRPMAAGTHYGAAAGVLPGNNEHSHFIFRTRRAGETRDVMLDPWMLFWQTFEQERAKEDGIRAGMEPRGPARTGETARFSSAGTRKGRWGVRLTHQWTFGDGGFSLEANPAHVYAKPGLYAVTLTVEDGVERASTTQLMTVDGAAMTTPALALASEEEIGFVRRRPEARDVYGTAPGRDPHMVKFTARWKIPAAGVSEVRAMNLGGGRLGAVRAAVEYANGSGWLKVEQAGERFRLRAEPGALTPGLYVATVRVAAEGAANSPQAFRVTLDLKQNRPPAEAVVDDADEGFFATPFYWVGHRFKFWKDKGHQGFYLTDGGREEAGAFARFTPDLRAGRYEVWLAEDTPFGLQPDTRFRVVVRHKGGRAEEWVEPARSRRIGVYEFEEGTAGWVQLESEGAKGHVLADAVRFRPVGTAQ